MLDVGSFVAMLFIGIPVAFCVLFDFYCIFSKTPEEKANIENIKLITRLLFLRGYNLRKVTAIINLYDH